MFIYFFPLSRDFDLDAKIATLPACSMDVLEKNCKNATRPKSSPENSRRTSGSNNTHGKWKFYICIYSIMHESVKSALFFNQPYVCILVYELDFEDLILQQKIEKCGCMYVCMYVWNNNFVKLIFICNGKN